VGAIFSRLDQNGDDRITAEEIPPDEVGRLTEADTNGDGVVERAEMRSAISRMSAGGPPEGR
jgi:hypothetical protein